MSWTAPTPSNVLEEFTPAERAQLANIQGGADNLTPILARVVAEFRQAIADAGRETDSDTTTMPDGFHGQAIALARWRWLISIPQAKAMQTPERKAAAEKAETLIEDIATGKRPVAPPDSSSGTGGIASPSFGTRGGSAANDPRAREFTRDTQDGI